MAYFGGGSDNSNRQPSFARTNGRQAIVDAIQNHMDRLAPNRNKSEFSGPRQPQRSNTGGGGPFGGLISAVSHPVRSAQQLYGAEKAGLQIAGHDIRRGWRHPVMDRPHGFNPYDVLGQVGRQAAQMFNPTTKTGLANIVGGFAGGPKDGFDASPAMERLGMPGQFTRYGSAVYKTGSALDRGIPNEGPGYPGAQGAGIRGLVRRAEGVGGYKQPNPGLTEMQRLEAELHARQLEGKTRDAIKEYSNRQGFANRNQGGFDAANKRTDMLMNLDELMGMRSIPYSMRDAVKPSNRLDEDLSGPKNLDTLMQYLAHYMNKGDDFSIGSHRAVWDQLFGGDFHFGRGFNRFPRKP